MNNVYLVQAGCLYGNTYYLPYAVGMLAAFAFDDDEVKKHYNLGRLIYALEDIDEAVESLDSPALVGFSNYIWNYDYNLSFAKKVKEKYPECIIEFGGHHVPPDTSFLEKYDFIDILVHRKGEEAFRDALKAYAGLMQLKDIPNISYRDENGKAVMNPIKEITLSEYPSPYLNGIFDDIIKNGKYPFSCILETNRGCPFNCAYCDWGDLNSSIRQFPIERVRAELEWMAENKMEFCYCVDSNFGIFERDEDIAKLLVKLKTTKGYPQRLQVSYAKNKPERVFRINKMLSEAGLSKGATISLQTLSDDVLKNIGRENLKVSHYVKQLSLYHEAGIPTYSELILGLPGETYDSFCQGLCEIIEMGQHNSVSAYYCELLPNSRMSSKEYMDKYGIKTICTTLGQWHCEPMDEEPPGYSNIVVETATMTKAEWVKSNVFSVCVQSFHHFGLLRGFAVYLNTEKIATYFEFYSRLLEWIKTNGNMTKKVFERTENGLNLFVEGKGGLLYQNDVFGKITWPFEEAVFLDMAYSLDKFYDEITPFLKEFGIEENLFNNLLEYQKHIIVLPNRSKTSFITDYDFYHYFFSAMSNTPVKLEKGKFESTFESPFAEDSWPKYAQFTTWYGRRNGRMVYTNDPKNVTVKKLSD